MYYCVCRIHHFVDHQSSTASSTFPNISINNRYTAPVASQPVSCWATDQRLYRRLKSTCSCRCYINSVEAAPTAAGDRQINAITSTRSNTVQAPRSTAQRRRSLARSVRAHHITEEIITVGRSPVVRSSRSAGRLPLPTAARRINQPKNYKHSTSLTHSSRRRLQLRYFSQMRVRRII